MKRLQKFALTGIAFILLTANPLYGQEEQKFGISFSGFVKNDVFVDSRQTITARMGHFLLWPAPEKLGMNGEDINASPVFNILAIQSRLSGRITGPDALGAKTSGLIEGDFFAQANDNINLFRMRHAFVKLNWTRMEFLAGHTWNPLFVTDCFPGTVSFNTGTPLQSFARNPQLRITFHEGGIKIIAAVLSQLDYVSRGPDGPACKYIRNSATPDMHLQLHYKAGNKDSGTGFFAGGGVAYKTIVPRLESEVSPGEIYKVDETVGGFTAIGFTKLTMRRFTLKFQARYGENIADVLAVSGYGVKEVTDPLTGRQSYTPLKSMSYWGEVHTNGNPGIGVFAGLFNNNGTREAMSSSANPVYGLSTNITNIYRISPRIIYNSGKVRLALEMEYTAAAYGTGFNESYLPDRSVRVANWRGLLAVYYFF